MKKLITLTFTLFLTAGLAFGQSNEADIQLRGDDNDATIEQSGFSNEAFIHQTGDSNGEETNGAYVDQIGADNEAYLTTEGDDNDFDISQDGTSHYSNGAIIGDENEVNVIQWDQNRSGSDDDNHAHFSIYDDASDGEGDGNALDVTQHGANNRFSGAIIGDDNDVVVEQYGAANDILGPDRNPFGQRGINIVGNDNDASVYQNGSSHFATMLIHGDNNDAVIKQVN